MAFELYLLVPLIAGLGAVVRGVAGFGPALVLVALASAFLPLGTVIVLAALLDLAGGAVLWVSTRRGPARAGWLSSALLFTAGAIAGGALFARASAGTLAMAAGATLALAGLRILVLQMSGDRGAPTPVERPGLAADRCVAAIAGVIGGLVAVGGYFLASWLVTRASREVFRNTMCRILLIGAIARAGTYAAHGFLEPAHLGSVAAALPLILAGNALGRRLHGRIPERTFRALVGAIVLAGAVNLILCAR